MLEAKWISCYHDLNKTPYFNQSTRESENPMAHGNKKQQDLELQQKHERNLELIRRLRLIDDDFMEKVFEDKACAELLLRIILERDDLTVQSVHGQHVVKNLQGRSIRMDILAVDTTGQIHNVEVQRSDKGAGVKRARYNSSLIDANITEAGDDYGKLNETYVIFITENDVLKGNLPIYHIDRVIRETGELFNDKSHIIYVNSKIQDETELGKLMSDFFCTDANDMNYKVLADRVRYFKEDEKGVASMSRVFEEIAREAAEKAARETAEKVARETAEKVARETAVKTAKLMLESKKLSYEEIAEFTQLTVEEIKELDSKRTA